MSIRIAAGILAIATVGLIAAPAEISARGFAGGRGMHAMGAFHGPIVRPGIVPGRPFAARPFARAPFARFRHRRAFDAGWPVGAWGDYSGSSSSSYYDPNAGAVSYEPPAAGYPPLPPPEVGPVRERIIYVMPARPSCSTQTYKVPAEGGGEKSINVVRC
jgi:hypothetical protein